MWLLHTSTFMHYYYPDERGVKYAILSHRWLDGEVLFDDVRVRPVASSHKSGWKKLKRACQQAKKDGFEYIWIDTCNINKDSSAELSEAINSMYRWYQASEVCYAYLSDIESGTNGKEVLNESEWFTRGWTLQELIAPQRILFFNTEWELLGTGRGLARRLENITGIPKELLRGATRKEDYSIAQRMSWAAGRHTTRIEDRAYSLMGLFNVNMPMLYGEGKQAFLRLQEEIIKQSADHSIFAWRYTDGDAYASLLAQSADKFIGCGHIKMMPQDLASGSQTTKPFQYTNIGLQITLPCRLHAVGMYHVALNCTDAENGVSPQNIGIFLGSPASAPLFTLAGRCLYAGEDRAIFPRTQDDDSKYREFIIPREPFPGSRPSQVPLGFVVKAFDVVVGPSEKLHYGKGVYVVARSQTWDSQTATLRLQAGKTGRTAVALALLHDNSTVPLLLAKLGFDNELRPWIWIVDLDSIHGVPRDVPTDATNYEAITAGQLSDPLGFFGQNATANIDEVLGEEIDQDLCARVPRTRFLMAHHTHGLNISENLLNVQIRRLENTKLDLLWEVQVRLTTKWISRPGSISSLSSDDLEAALPKASWD